MRVQVCEEDLAWLREYRTEELCEVFDAVHLDLAPANTKVGVSYLFLAFIQMFCFKPITGSVLFFVVNYRWTGWSVAQWLG